MAVYTEIPDADLHAFLRLYDLGPAISCKGIAEGVENSNFLLRTGKGMFILTLFEKRVQETDLPYFIGLMDHLNRKGFPCPLPQRHRKGSALAHLCGRPAMIVTFLDGIWPRQPADIHCYELGQAAAEFHVKSEDFKLERKNALGLEGWTTLTNSLVDKARQIDPDLPRFLIQELSWLEQRWPDNLPKGHIHADLFPDNVFFIDHDISGIIDFYFACTDYLMYELAIILNAWCFEADGRFSHRRASSLFEGYRTIRPLLPQEMEALPILARGAALRFLLTRAYDWLHQEKNALVTPKNPMEYVQKLKFHQTIGTGSAYFAHG